MKRHATVKASSPIKKSVEVVSLLGQLLAFLGIPGSHFNTSQSISSYGCAHLHNTTPVTPGQSSLLSPTFPMPVPPHPSSRPQSCPPCLSEPPTFLVSRFALNLLQFPVLNIVCLYLATFLRAQSIVPNIESST